jgi:hypothetical protein
MTPQNQTKGLEDIARSNKTYFGLLAAGNYSRAFKYYGNYLKQAQKA